MSARTVFSIGLNVGATEPAGQLHATLAAVMDHGTVISLGMGASRWAGVPERFIQAMIEVRGWPSDAAATLARTLRQDAIAVTHIPAYPHARWWLYNTAGKVSKGGTLAQFPLIVRAP